MATTSTWGGQATSSIRRRTRSSAFLRLCRRPPTSSRSTGTRTPGQHDQPLRRRLCAKSGRPNLLGPETTANIAGWWRPELRCSWSVCAVVVLGFRELRHASESRRGPPASASSASIADGLILQHVTATRFGRPEVSLSIAVRMERRSSDTPHTPTAWKSVGGLPGELTISFRLPGTRRTLATRRRLLRRLRKRALFTSSTARREAIERTHRLRYYGPGKGRGLMAFGLATDATAQSISANTPQNRPGHIPSVSG